MIQFTAGQFCYCTACGLATLTACTRLKSRPSRSAANCAAESRITPSWMRGQQNFPSSSRFAKRHSPVPSQKISLTLSARLDRKHQIVPEKGSPRSCSFTSAARLLGPLRKSTGIVATSTRTGPGGINIPLLMAKLPEPCAVQLRAYRRQLLCPPAPGSTQSQPRSRHSAYRLRLYPALVGPQPRAQILSRPQEWQNRRPLQPESSSTAAGDANRAAAPPR